MVKQQRLTKAPSSRGDLVGGLEERARRLLSGRVQRVSNPHREPRRCAGTMPRSHRRKAGKHRDTTTCLSCLD
eukprot:4642644-Prymnesium_polylepis.3